MFFLLYMEFIIYFFFLIKKQIVLHDSTMSQHETVYKITLRICRGKKKRIKLNNDKK